MQLFITAAFYDRLLYCLGLFCAFSRLGLYDLIISIRVTVPHHKRSVEELDDEIDDDDDDRMAIKSLTRPAIGRC